MDESVTPKSCPTDRQIKTLSQTMNVKAKRWRETDIKRRVESGDVVGWNPVEWLDGLETPTDRKRKIASVKRQRSLDIAVTVSDFDVEAFLHHFDGMELTKEEKHELLYALWQIMCRFVEIGFGLDSHTLAQKPDAPCGKLNADDADESGTVVN